MTLKSAQKYAFCAKRTSKTPKKVVEWGDATLLFAL